MGSYKGLMRLIGFLNILFPLAIFVSRSAVVSGTSNVVTVTEAVPEGGASNSSMTDEQYFDQRLQNLEFHTRYYDELSRQWQQNFKIINARLAKLEKIVGASHMNSSSASENVA